MLEIPAVLMMRF